MRPTPARGFSIGGERKLEARLSPFVRLRLIRDTGVNRIGLQGDRHRDRPTRTARRDPIDPLRYLGDELHPRLLPEKRETTPNSLGRRLAGVSIRHDYKTEVGQLPAGGLHPWVPFRVVEGQHPYILRKRREALKGNCRRRFAIMGTSRLRPHRRSRFAGSPSDTTTAP